MNFLPIVERELRAASRRPATYWGRLQLAGMVMVPTFMMLWGPAGLMTTAQQGVMIFGIISTLALYGVVFASARWASDCISSEKREGTLGFLFLTDLKPRDVLLGKLSASSLGALYGLLAVIPILAIPLMLGGVTLMDVVRLGIVLLNTVFFALSVAVLVSTVCWQQRQAMTLTVIFLAGIALGIPAVAAIVQATVGGPGISWIMTLSPTFAAGMISNYRAAPGAFWLSIGATHVMGWLFFATACFVLPRIWQDRPVEGGRLRWRNITRSFLLGRPDAQRVFRGGLLGMNPIYWFASRERRMVWYPWLLIASVFLLLVVWPMIFLKSLGFGYWPVLLGCFGVNWFFKHWIGNVACAAFSTDRDKGAMELLLSTRLEVRDFLRGQALALRRQFFWPIVALLVGEALLLVVTAATDRMEDHPLLMGVCIAATIVMFVPDALAMVWAGWWAGVAGKNAAAAVNSVYLRVMVPAFVMGLLTSALLPFCSFYFSWNFTTEMFGSILLTVWLLGGGLADYFAITRSRQRLLRDMRTAIVERNAGGDPAMIWWRRLGRFVGRWVARRRTIDHVRQVRGGGA